MDNFKGVLKKIQKFFRSKLEFSTLQGRLLFSFVLITLVPSLAISAASIIVGYTNGQERAFEQLQTNSALKEQEIRAWIYSINTELFQAYDQEYNVDRMINVLELSDEAYYIEYYIKSLQIRFDRYVDNSQFLEEVFLMDLEGEIVLSSEDSNEGNYQTNLLKLIEEEQFDNNMQLFYQTGEETKAFFSIPVYQTEGELLYGYFIGRATLTHLEQDLQELIGLGNTGKSYLVDNESRVLTNIRSSAHEYESVQIGDNIQSTGIQNVLADSKIQVGYFRDFVGDRIIGYYRLIPDIDTILIVEQDLLEAFRGILTTMQVNIVVAVFAVAFAVFISVIVSRSISKPLTDLAGFVTRIAAGDFNQKLGTERSDEIGTLSTAINSMSSQLNELVTRLEDRVRERTGELRNANNALSDANISLHHRALQLEASTTVSREITSIINNLDELLHRVVDLIKDSFGYYCVNIYFYDEELQILKLQCSSDISYLTTLDEISLDMNSLNGRAFLTQKTVVANDVNTSPEYLFDAEFPETRSELVIPLNVGSTNIGTLDVLGKTINAFPEDDTLVLESLADQIAIAIENARLYENSKKLAVLEERNRLARELHDAVIQSLYSLTLLAGSWKRMKPENKEANIEEYINDFYDIAQRALKEMRIMVHNLKPPELENEGLLGALHNRLDAVERRSGIETRLIANNVIDLDLIVEREVYRIVQEALNNILKHSCADSVCLQLNATEVLFTMEIVDNGVGFNLDTIPEDSGMGLSNMKTRAESLGGTFIMKSHPGEGTSIKIEIPLGETG